MSRDDDRLVYSSGTGPVERRRKERPGSRSAPAAGSSRRDPDDGVARVRRERKGRRGKTVTTVSGLPLDETALRDLAADLKRHCGSGGGCKDGVIEVQGDHADTVLGFLQGRGLEAKRAGG